MSILILSALLALTVAEQNATTILHNGNLDFTVKFFQEVLKSMPDKSVVMSAYSVLTPLAQLSLAAEGDSQQELLTTLGIPNINVLKWSFKTGSDKIRSVQGVTLKMANRIYVNYNKELNKEFNALCMDLFDTEVKKVDFSKRIPAAAAINEWVESQTNNRIKNLVDASSLSPKTSAVLVNAIYFKGKWLKPFDQRKTQMEEFHSLKEDRVNVPMMSQTNGYLYGYSEELESHLLEIPYENKGASFLVILPKLTYGIISLEKKLKDPHVLTKAMNNMSERMVYLSLPKFQIETSINLKHVLKNIGVTKIFDYDNAHLTKLLKSDDKIYVTDALQKAFIEVNEEGAEAAAANSNVVGMRPMVEPWPTRVVADHPFMFAIKVDNEIIFSGVFHG